MKGLVFTTFYDFCETNFSADLLDDIIAESGVPHDGAYTSVGTYPFEEMVALVTSATAVAGIGLRSLLERFGEHCFNKWVGYVPAHFQGKDLFDVLASIDTFHEDEVRKLYPDAELPSFVVESRSARELTLCCPVEPGIAPAGVASAVKIPQAAGGAGVTVTVTASACSLRIPRRMAASRAWSSTRGPRSWYVVPCLRSA